MMTDLQAHLYWKRKMLDAPRTGNKWKIYRARANWYFRKWDGRLDIVIHGSKQDE